MTLQTKKLSPHIGIEVTGLDLRNQPSEAVIAEIYRLWLDNLVILFRDQALDQDDLVRVTGYFGPPGAHARPQEYRTSGQHRMVPGIMLISNVRENGEPIGALPDGDMMFHHDMMHAEVPHRATCLYAVDIPSTGGNTLFASGYAAYDALEPTLRERLQGKRAFHHYNYGSQHRGDDIGTPAFAESEHPVFVTHPETGRKAIYVDRLMTNAIVGLDKSESDAILDDLFDHSEQDAFVYEHVWRKGDLLLWDNLSSMHARRDFPSTERRLMWRTTVEGEQRPQ